jgi:maleamate amidohydrolase
LSRFLKGGCVIFVSIAEAAKLLGVSPATLRRLESGDEVRGYGVRVYHTPGGQRRYLRSEIEQFYLERGFAGRVGFGVRPGILAIDCINAFTRTGSPLGGEWGDEIAAINGLTAAARKAKFPVILSKSYYDETDAALRLWVRKIRGINSLVLGSEEVELDSRIEVRAKDHQIFSKFSSVYYGTDLLEHLRRHDVDTLIITGFSTSGSVRAVAAESLQYGIRPIVPMEAVGDREENMHRTNLRDIDRKFADVLPLAEVLDYLESAAAGIPTVEED